MIASTFRRASWIVIFIWIAGQTGAVAQQDLDFSPLPEVHPGARSRPDQARGLEQEPGYETEDVLLFLPRLVAAVPGYAFRAVFFPLQMLLTLFDKYPIAEQVVDFLYNDERSAAVLPFLLYQSSFGLTAGLVAFHHDLLGNGEHLSFDARYGGIVYQAYKLRFGIGDKPLGDQEAILLSPLAAAVRSRYQQERVMALLRSGYTWGKPGSFVKLGATCIFNHRVFGPLADGSSDELSVEEVYDTSTLTGFDHGLKHVIELQGNLVLDFRNAAGLASSGVLLRAFFGGVPPQNALNYIHYGFESLVYLNLFRDTRVLVLRTALEKDARGINFLVKFDTKNNPEMQTAADVICNRILWALGYNVPSDHVFWFRREDLHVDPQATFENELREKQPLTRELVDEVLKTSPTQPDGFFRALASEYLEGKPKGGAYPEGVRSDDPNDTVPHEHRRDLRALRVFAAWLNHSDMKEDNSLDVYVEQDGRRFLKHYLLDLGEALGGHVAEKGRYQDGWEYYLDWPKVMAGMLSFGLWKRPWEDTQETPWLSVGSFSDQPFDPAAWQEAYPYWPFWEMDQADAYWGAKLVMRFDRPLIEAVVAEGRLSHPAGAVVSQPRPLAALERGEKMKICG